MTRSQTAVRLQNLREFTVQVRHGTTHQITGTGIVVSERGLILTCAHVVLAAGVNPRSGSSIPSVWKLLLGSTLKTDASLGEVEVYFPQARKDDLKTRRARVAQSFRDSDDDLVLLELIGEGPAPILPDHVARLGNADDSLDHEFISYGFRRLGDYSAGRASGKILGGVQTPEGLRVLADPIQLQSSQINRGMSGAPVLDVVRNLVVGIVSETWFPDETTKDRDTAWAINVSVASHPPIELSLQDHPEPLKAGFRPEFTELFETEKTGEKSSARFFGVPDAVLNWVGREDLEHSLSSSWSGNRARVIALVGFGGQGKSALVRHWLDSLFSDSQGAKPDSVFWWNFGSVNSIEAFLAAALTFVARGKIDVHKFSNAGSQAEVLGAMLGSERFLFVLDGLEEAQYEEGDQSGLFRRDELRRLLQHFAHPSHNSVCVVTTRLSVLDLLDYTTVVELEVGSLSISEGRALLQSSGIAIRGDILEDIVTHWGGYALALNLIAGALAEGQAKPADLARFCEYPQFEWKHQQLDKLLDYYESVLQPQEESILDIASAFRRPISEAAVLELAKDPTLLIGGRLSQLDDAALVEAIARLKHLRILVQDTAQMSFTLHPIIKLHRFGQLAQRGNLLPTQLHIKIADYYIRLANIRSPFPRMEELQPLIEAVHHGCQARQYGNAFKIYWELLSNNCHYLLAYLGAYDVVVDLLAGFFPDHSVFGTAVVPDEQEQWALRTYERMHSADEVYFQPDILSEPVKLNQVRTPALPGPAGRMILQLVGTCFARLGELGKAWPVLTMAYIYSVGSGQDQLALNSHLWISDVEMKRGLLSRAIKTSESCLAGAKHLQNRSSQMSALSLIAYGHFLKGDMKLAGDRFEEALETQRSMGRADAPSELWSIPGLRHARYLIRRGEYLRAGEIVKENLAANSRWSNTPEVSMEAREDICAWTCLLGDLAAAANNSKEANDKYAEAAREARALGNRALLIETLSQRGRWVARSGKTADAIEILTEALDLALSGGFFISQADIRLSFALAYRGNEKNFLSRQQLVYALEIAKHCEYAWVELDMNSEQLQS